MRIDICDPGVQLNPKLLNRSFEKDERLRMFQLDQRVQIISQNMSNNILHCDVHLALLVIGFKKAPDNTLSAQKHS